MTQEFESIKISPAMIASANARSNNFDYPKQHVHGAGPSHPDFQGFIGEAAFWKLMDGAPLFVNTADADFLFNDFKVDVKTQVSKKYDPKPWFHANISQRDAKRNPDIYAFGWMDSKYTKFWFLGWMKKHEFIDKARLMSIEERQKERGGDNNFLPSYELKIKDLHSLAELRALPKKADAC